MRAFSVVRINPCVEFLLQLIDVFEYDLAERHLVKFLQDRAVKAFAYAVGLRRLRFGFRVLDVVDGKI